MGAGQLVAAPCCNGCDEGTGGKAAQAIGSVTAPKPKSLGQRPKQNVLTTNNTSIVCCPEEDIAQDEGAVLDYQLLSASADGDVNMIRDALDRGANIEARRPLVFRTEPSPAPAADDEEDFQEVLVLEGQGVFQSRGFGYAERSPKETKNQGLTPLMRASKEGRVQAVALLLEKKATPHCQDEEGKTPLHFAAAAGCRASCATLLRSGANRWVLDDGGRDAFSHVPREFLCTTKDRGEWVMMLRGTEADRTRSRENVANPTGSTGGAV